MNIVVLDQPSAAFPHLYEYLESGTRSSKDTEWMKWAARPVEGSIHGVEVPQNVRCCSSCCKIAFMFKKEGFLATTKRSNSAQALCVSDAVVLHVKVRADDLSEKANRKPNGLVEGLGRAERVGEFC